MGSCFCGPPGRSEQCRGTASATREEGWHTAKAPTQQGGTGTACWAILCGLDCNRQTERSVSTGVFQRRWEVMRGDVCGFNGRNLNGRNPAAAVDVSATLAWVSSECGSFIACQAPQSGDIEWRREPNNVHTRSHIRVASAGWHQ